MAKMNFDDEGVLDEPCLSCDKPYVENIWHEWCCDEKECPYEAGRKGGLKMDLGAYAQIENLNKIAEENGIEVPRLRGYGLMKNEEPFDLKKIDKKEIALDCVKELCRNVPFWNPNSNVALFSNWTDYLCDYFMVKGKDEDGYEKYIEIRWNRIHGWKRKVLKTYIHNKYMRQRRQWEVWNKYAGKDDVLYIHARIGGNNWPYYFDEVVGKSWFLEKVDDAFDSTYCDIYAKIKSQAEVRDEE